MRLLFIKPFFIVLFCSLLLEAREYSIYKSTILSSELEKIGNANFNKRKLNLKGKEVIQYKIDLKFKNLGKTEVESFETVSDANNFEIIYYRYTNSKNSVTGIRVNDLIRVFVNYFGQTNETSVKLVSGSFASTFLYLRLQEMINSGEKKLDYKALSEDDFLSSGSVYIGRASYKGFVENKDGKKNHVFLNSYKGEQSVIYYDYKGELERIEMLKPGLSIHIIRN